MWPATLRVQIITQSVFFVTPLLGIIEVEVKIN